MSKKTKKDPKVGDKQEQQINLTVKEIREKYGEGAIMKLGEVRRVDVDVIPTGSLSLDIALGVGGVPRGRIIEIYGPESAGKTSLALHIVAEAQRRGGIAAYVDAEHALDPEYARKIGVNVDDLLISQPDTGEQALDIVESLVRSGNVDVVVIDSVAALTPAAEIEAEMEAQSMGAQARLMSRALRKLTAIVSKSKTTVIFINQLRMKIGVMFGCLSYTSRVNTLNGPSQKIGKIVNQKKKTEILSYDWKKGEIVPKPITSWFNNGKADRFLQITTYKPSGNGMARVACTPNHPILTPVGWIRAEALKVGDSVMVGVKHSLSSFQLEAIRGSLLGDGALSYSASNHMGVRFRMGHGKEQERYLRWKAGLFSNIKSSITKNKKDAIFCDLTPLPELFSIRRSMYINGKKFLTPEFISALTPFSLAIWYMDDAHLDIRDKKQTKARICICVEALEANSRSLLLEHIKYKYDIEGKLVKQGYKTIIVFDQHNSNKFQQLIKKYIHPSMRYKLLPVYRNYFNVKPAFAESVLKPMPMPVTDIHIKPRTRSMIRFDIGVKRTHNFLADGIIVHNSPETTPGGMALKFYSSVRIDIRRSAQIQSGERIVGNRVKVKIVKNKVAPPFRTAEFDILYNEGISKYSDILSTGVRFNIIGKAGSWYTYGNQKLGQGIEGARQFLKEDSKLEKEIVQKIRDAATAEEGVPQEAE